MTLESRPTHRTNSQRPIPYWIWAPLVAGGLIFVAGILGLVFHQPWIFPSLGPTAFLQAEQPNAPFSKLYNTIVGHLIGLSTGLLAVFVFHAADAPSVLATGTMTELRVGAAVLSVTLNMWLGILLKASHPPAAATTLLVSLGGFKPNFQSILTIMIGVVIVATLGEVLRRLRLRH